MASSAARPKWTVAKLGGGTFTGYPHLMTKDLHLRTTCLCFAALAATIAAACIILPPIQPLLYPATIATAAVAALLFLRILLSPTYRQGISAANTEMRGSHPWPGKRKRYADPDWGIFGARTGSPPLLWLRVLLLSGLVLTILFQNRIGRDIVLLWAAATFIALELSLMHMALSQPRDRV